MRLLCLGFVLVVFRVVNVNLSLVCLLLLFCRVVVVTFVCDLLCACSLRVCLLLLFAYYMLLVFGVGVLLFLFSIYLRVCCCSWLSLHFVWFVVCLFVWGSLPFC